MTILTRPIKRELPQRVAHRQLVVELHPGFVQLCEKFADQFKWAESLEKKEPA